MANYLLLYRRSRVPGPVSGVHIAVPTANGLALQPRPRLRIPGVFSFTYPQGASDLEAWLDSVTPFTTIGNNTQGQFEAWLDSVTPFTELA